MLIERIHAYLKSQEKTLSPDILAWATGQFERQLRRQFMEERKSRPGHMYATLVTGHCARQAAYKYLMFPPDEQLQPRVLVNFFCGDVVEVAVLALAKIAGCDLATPFELLARDEKMDAVWNGDKIRCWPDAVAQAGGTWLNVEIKKLSDYTFDSFEKRGGPADDWGLRTQCMLEMLAWRQAGIDVRGTLMLGLRGLTGHMAEWTVPFEPELVEAAFARKRRVEQANPTALPPRGFGLVETKEGRKKLVMQCNYCSFKKTCWPGLVVEVQRGKPVFFVEQMAQAPLAIGNGGGV